jgi:hypothetical protein
MTASKAALMAEALARHPLVRVQQALAGNEEATEASILFLQQHLSQSASSGCALTASCNDILRQLLPLRSSRALEGNGIV